MIKWIMNESVKKKPTQKIKQKKQAQVSEIWNTIRAFCYCVWQRSSWRISTGKSRISDVGAILIDGAASCWNKKQEAYSKPMKI